jgi:hypothetical protein
MANQKFSLNLEDEFAEKCRKALEKSWGIEIPKPKLNQKPLMIVPSCEGITN